MQTVSYLTSDIKYLKGVGPALSKFLNRLGIYTIADLLFHLPTSIIDRRHSPRLSANEAGKVVTLKLKVLTHPAGSKARYFPYRVLCQTEHEEFIEVVFFNGSASIFKKSLPEGSQRYVSGKLEMYGHKYQIAHPDFIELPENKDKIMKVQPVYALTEGITSNKLAKLAETALEGTAELPEWIDTSVIKKQKWQSFKSSITSAHHPKEDADVECMAPSHQRLGYDEALASQLALLLARQKIKKEKIYSINHRFELAAKVISKLPFKLTDGQRNVLHEIMNDMKSGEKMTRLLQGDVGSGKTAVALIAATFAIEQGKQAAIMVPTSILCQQQFAWIAPLAEACGVNCEVISGSDKGKEKEAKLTAIESGKTSLVIGTHALFQSNVKFKNLGLAIIDEQHRFGVEQRMALFDKGQCHTLFMTATPIPRTLTMAAYGDLDLSVLKEKPAGRKPIETRIMPLTKLEEVVEAMKRAITNDNRIYWICPLVEESEKVDISAAEDRFEHLKQVFGNKVAMVHGRIKPAEREVIMNAFARGEYSILIATTVIEVGVNVPEATIMIIEHAERFGLSQLHQLRGRVGRGEKKSSCILLYGKALSENGMKRLKIMRETEDGFKIAEEDLNIRGGGEILGTRQSGLANFRMLDLFSHTGIFEMARDDALLFLNKDPHLTSERGVALKNLLKIFGKDSYEKFSNS